MNQIKVPKTGKTSTKSDQRIRVTVSVCDRQIL